MVEVCSHRTTRVPWRDQVSRKLSSHEAGAQQTGTCSGGHIRGGLEGADGGRAEEIKVPAGPQTVTAVGLCPLPPSPEPLASQPCPGWGAAGAPRASSALPPWRFLASLSVSWSRPVSCVSESPSFPLPYLVCATRGIVCDRGLCKCSCRFNELICVPPCLSVPRHHPPIILPWVFYVSL